MQKQHRNTKKFFLLGILFLMLFLCTTAQAEAGWKKNTNGTYSYYNKKGKKLKSKWIKNTYYVNSKGVRQTGWMYHGKKWYYFGKNGKVVKSKWLKSGKNMYYASSSGALYTNGYYKIGGAYYAFNKRGVKLYGKHTFKGKTYYFGLKTGKMMFKTWGLSGKQYYYFDKTGVMVTNRWVGRYYVTKNGSRLKKSWKDNRYLGSNGKAVTGLQKIGGKYYYFDSKTWRKVTNKSVTVKDVTYVFDGNGVGTAVKNGEIPAASVAVEKEYYSDPNVSNETLLAALIYREAGNQSSAGKTAVGLVVMNRVLNKSFPSTIREVIYQKNQFRPSNTAAFTRLLKNPALIPADCKKIASDLLDKFSQYKKGQKVQLKVNGKVIDFPHLFFMTNKAYASQGLKTKYLQLGAHVFFTKWA